RVARKEKSRQRIPDLAVTSRCDCTNVLEEIRAVVECVAPLVEIERRQLSAPQLTSRARLGAEVSTLNGSKQRRLPCAVRAFERNTHVSAKREVEIARIKPPIEADVEPMRLRDELLGGKLRTDDIGIHERVDFDLIQRLVRGANRRLRGCLRFHVELAATRLRAALTCTEQNLRRPAPRC